MIIYISSAVICIILLCLCFPMARYYYIDAVKSSLENLRSIFEDFFILPFRTSVKWKHFLVLPFALIIFLLAVAFFIALLIIVVPVASMIKAFSTPKTIGNSASTKSIEVEPDFVSFKAPLRYRIPLDELLFDPSSQEVIFYNPSGRSDYDVIIDQNIEEIKRVFSIHGMRFIYLPDYNLGIDSASLQSQLLYANPRLENVVPGYHSLTYSDIAEAYQIPESVDEPCLVRCMSSDGDRGFRLWSGKTYLTGISFDESFLYFSIKILESTDSDSFIAEIRTYLRNCYSGPLYHIDSKEETEAKLAGLSADERFDDDVYIIGREIRERVDMLRARGLSSLAIRKLIDDESDKPGKLLIDKHNKLILTDFGNKEIKLEPLHKAVFFLFLRHPEGIYFKDLGDYREELGAIYREITGREDLTGIQDSINKLTDPLNNSINEKCARIKNAFVSEFREEIAQWYFIDGSRGEKKAIKLPRELVTWEIKD